MKSFRLALVCPLFLATGWAQTTRTWEQNSYDDFERGTAHGIAISSDGTLTLAPSFTSLYTSPSTYIWDIACDAEGNVYAAAGSPARVYKITPDGKARIIFAPQELQVQALVVDKSGAIYAATSPDGKVYKLVHGGPTPGQAPEGVAHHGRSRCRAGRREACASGRESRAPRSPSIPATARRSSSIPRRNTSGRWRSIARASSTLAPAIVERSIASTATATVRCSSRATKRRFACSPSIAPATCSPGTDGSGLDLSHLAAGRGLRAI